MFSTKEQLITRTGKHGVGRFSFLEQLVNEYKVTKSRDAKEQVLANLANFAYDPVNYDYLWRLKVLDLFLNALDDNNKKIVSFAIGGICNICLEPLSKQYILRNNGIKKISSLLQSSQESVILSSITILMYLDSPKTRSEIVSTENVKLILELSKNTSRRIQNLANIFLKELCNFSDKDLPFAKTSATVNIKKGVKRKAVTSTITSVNIGASTKLYKHDKVNTSTNSTTSASSVTNSTAVESTSTAPF